MVYYCAYGICRNSNLKRPDLSFHTFPSEPKRRKKWTECCQRKDKEFKVTQHSSVCSLHFKKDDFKVTLTGRRMLKPTAVPNSIENVKKMEESTTSKRNVERGNGKTVFQFVNM